MLARSAPVRLLVWRAISSRSTPGSSGLLRVWTSRMARRPFRSGAATRIWRSKRPGRSSAGSSFSSRFEAAITTTFSAEPKPSSSTSSWLSVWSFSPEMSLPRVAPTASSSSMKTIAGASLRAGGRAAGCARRRGRRTSRRTRTADWAKNLASASLAAALASSVLPVPGGPCSRMPFGTLAPSLRKRFGSRRNSTTSRSSSLASSAPATSCQRTELDELGLISCGFVRGR